MTSRDAANWAIYWLGIGFVLGCLAVGAAGCGGDPQGGLCETEPATEGGAVAYIVGGEESVDRRGTVRLLLANGNWCSGTVIGPGTVLSAAHCNAKPVIVQVQDCCAFPVVSVEAHPEFSFPERDLLLVYVEGTLPEPYVPILRDPAGCSSLLAQGYGAPSGTLYERSVEYFYRTDEAIFGGESICRGDSGGPLYAIGPRGVELAGVASFGFDTGEGCVGATNGWINLLTYGDWVEERIR